MVYGNIFIPERQEEHTALPETLLAVIYLPKMKLTHYLNDL